LGDTRVESLEEEKDVGIGGTKRLEGLDGTPSSASLLDSVDVRFSDLLDFLKSILLRRRVTVLPSGDCGFSASDE